MMGSGRKKRRVEQVGYMESIEDEEESPLLLE